MNRAEWIYILFFFFPETPRAVSMKTTPTYDLALISQILTLAKATSVFCNRLGPPPTLTLRQKLTLEPIGHLLKYYRTSRASFQVRRL